MAGKKDDKGKPRFSLVPWDAMEEVVLALEHGAREYGDDNWTQLSGAKLRFYNAAMRHIVRWKLGTARDAKSGLHHLAHATTCLLFLLAFELRGSYPPDETSGS